MTAKLTIEALTLFINFKTGLALSPIDENIFTIHYNSCFFLYPIRIKSSI